MLPFLERTRFLKCYEKGVQVDFHSFFCVCHKCYPRREHNLQQYPSVQSKKVEIKCLLCCTGYPSSSFSDTFPAEWLLRSYLLPPVVKSHDTSVRNWDMKFIKTHPATTNNHRCHPVNQDWNSKVDI